VHCPIVSADCKSFQVSFLKPLRARPSRSHPSGSGSLVLQG
jgi:hypothetical protein